MNDVIVTAQGIRKYYKDSQKEVKAVNGVDISISRSSTVAIIGPSGAGKSTLLHILGGLDKPTSGKVTIDGVDIFKLSDSDRARIRNRKIGFVFQFYHLMPEFTSLENVMLPALINGNNAAVKSGALRQRACDLLELVGLKNRTGHKPSELSGGESQRVAIARALMNEPDILLCDEPTGNLDSKNREMIHELLLGVKAKADTTLVIVTHDEKISSLTDSVVHLKDGKLD